jgi:hypothetical protein
MRQRSESRLGPRTSALTRTGQHGDSPTFAIHRLRSALGDRFWLEYQSRTGRLGAILAVGGVLILVSTSRRWVSSLFLVLR